MKAVNRGETSELGQPVSEHFLPLYRTCGLCNGNIMSSLVRIVSATFAPFENLGGASHTPNVSITLL